jgi:flagellar motor switch protein FliG
MKELTMDESKRDQLLKNLQTKIVNVQNAMQDNLIPFNEFINACDDVLINEHLDEIPDETLIMVLKGFSKHFDLNYNTTAQVIGALDNFMQDLEVKKKIRKSGDVDDLIKETFPESGHG